MRRYLCKASVLLYFAGSFACGSLDGSGSGSGMSVTLLIKNPDENASGTAKTLSSSEVFQSKAVSTSSFSECTLTASGSNSASTTVSVPSGASQIKATFDVPAGNNYTICAECLDGGKTSNGVGAGIRGCANNVSIVGSDQVSISALFLNLASRSSGDVRYCRIRQDNGTQMKIVCGFNGTLTTAQKSTAQCNLEIDSSLKDASPETVSASQSNGLISGTKGNPYFVIGPGLNTPACNQYNTGGSKILKCTGAWGTDGDEYTTMEATLGVKQAETIASGRNARFAAACTKNGSSWIAIPSSGMAEFNTSKGGNGDVSSLIADGGSCSTANSGRDCSDGICASGGVCFSISNTFSTAWTKTYNGSANGNDRGNDIALDSNNNIYVCGFESVTGEGVNGWLRKYNSAGDTVWTKTYNGTSNGSEQFFSIAVDSSSNVYVVGYETITGESTNIWIRKYDTSGNTVWTRTYNGSGSGQDIVYNVAVDSSNNVYITGYETVTGESTNIWIRKYDSDGNTLWTQTYNGTANQADRSDGSVLDSSGNIYVAGSETVTGQGLNGWLRKYDTNGNTIWTQTYNGTANGLDQLFGGIAVDMNGSVYVTGIEILTGEGYNMFVKKYDPDGNLVWTKTHNGSANADDVLIDAVLDPAGDLYVSGYEAATGQNDNIWIRKYDSDGNTLWSATYNSSASGADGGAGITFDSSGNIYVTGSETVSGEDRNIWIRKYQP